MSRPRFLRRNLGDPKDIALLLRSGVIWQVPLFWPDAMRAIRHCGFWIALAAVALCHPARAASLEDLVAAKVAEYDLDSIHEVLREGGVPAAPVNTVDRLMNEPQVEHRRMVVPVTHSTLGEISIIGQPMKFSAMEARKTE